MKRAWLLFICVLVVAFAAEAEAEVRLPGFFNDGMVLQRDMEVPVWGWAASGEKITVEFADRKATAITDEFGSWMVHLKPMTSSVEGRTMTISSSIQNHQSKIQNILIGEVWLCSGTANMDLPVRKSRDSGKVIKGSANPLIRICKIKKEQSPLPENNIQGNWQACGPQTLSEFSAAGYYFAKKLQAELGVPVGILQATWSKTGMNPWIPAEGYRDTPEMKWGIDQIYGGRPSSEEGKKAWTKYLKDLEEWMPKAKQAIANGETPVDRPALPSKLWITNIVPTKIFNGMINPMIPYAIRGVIWDEYESLERRPKECVSRHKALINSWRKLWNQDFSFYFVQAAGAKNEELRALQQKCLEIPKTGMAESGDVADPVSAGERMALLALSKDYGIKNDNK